MNARVSKFLTTVLGLTVTTAAAAASPTPNLKTGNYAGQRVIVVVGDKTAYGGDGVAANKHPTTISYNATSQTYTLYDYDGGPGTTFSPGEIVASSSSAAYTFYRDTSTGSTLKLLNDSASNPVIALNYVTYGKWIIPQSAPIHFADDYVVFGQLTPPSAVPRSGSASYKAILDGTYQSGVNTYRLSGNATFTASFGTGIMGLSVTPIGTNTVNGTQLTFGTLTGSGYITYDSSSFGATSRTRAADGTKTLFSATGNFYGPSAQEIGGVFTLSQTLGTQQIGEGGGAFVGKKN
jgi:hypothetical protein